MPHTFIITKKEDGTFVNTKDWRRFLEDCEAGKIEVKARSLRKRSLSQNNWLHAICPMIMEGLQSQGWMEIDTPAKAKDFLKAKFFTKSISNGSEWIDIVESTSGTDKQLFTERAEKIIVWAMDYLGIDIAPPGGQTNMFY